MPVINTRHIQGNLINGSELIEKGVKEVEGEKVSAEKKYLEKVVSPVPINHNRRMKKLYNQKGLNGVQAYINAVNSYISKQQPSK